MHTHTHINMWKGFAYVLVIKWKHWMIEERRLYKNLMFSSCCYVMSVTVNSNIIWHIFMPERWAVFSTIIKAVWKYLISRKSKLLSWKCEHVHISCSWFVIAFLHEGVVFWNEFVMREDVRFRSRTHHYTRRIKPNPAVVLIRCWQTFLCVSLCTKKVAGNTQLYDKPHFYSFLIWRCAARPAAVVRWHK